jgi:ABC-type dipeptide/oligopeptide/nickel transport system permease subunit
MAREGQEYITRQLSLALIPAAAITIFVVAWNFLGDGLRDVFDRSNRGRG